MSFFDNNLLNIVNKFSIAGYQNKDTAIIGETNVFKFTKLIIRYDIKIADIYTPLSPKKDLPKTLNIKNMKRTNNISL